MHMSYTPLSGTIPFRAIAHLNALAPGAKIANGVLADALEVDPAILTNTLKTAVCHGAIKREKVDNRTYWMRGDGKPPPPAEDYEPDEPLKRRPKPATTPKPATPFVGQAATPTAADVVVTPKRPPAKLQEPAEQPLQACKGEFAVFGYFSDGRISIEADGKQIQLDQQDTYELVKFVRRVFG